MPPALAAVLPVFLLILAGWGFRKGRFLDDGFWAPAEKLTFHVLIPCLIIRALAAADLTGHDLPRLALALLGPTLLLAALLFAARPLLWRGRGPAFTSVLQGSLRFNMFITLAILQSLWGPPALAPAAVALAVIPPTLNVLCIWALARHGAAAAPTFTGSLKQMARNPFILSAAAGICLNASGLGLPALLDGAMAVAGGAALPLGLFACGAGLRLHVDRRALADIAGAAILKLAILPALGLLACGALGITGLDAAVVVLFLGTPTAMASYILARQLGGDAPLMARIVSFETLAGAATLALWAGHVMR